MTYFSDSHDQIHYVLGNDDRRGLRRGQIGAIHSISAHFSLQTRPGIVVLPTGAGKTAVLMLTPYVLRSQRTLVITPSRFVREQIMRDYSNLSTLKAVGAVPEDLVPPKIFENRKMINTLADWEALREYDVVISTPNTVSPARADIAMPPPDLFDTVLIDEGHHSPAPTWTAIVRAFTTAMCVVFTATPFRLDKKEIKGKYIYMYPIQRAFEDGIYGEMQYISVNPLPEENPDVTLAREVEKVFNADRDAQLSHVLMVRAESRKRANELFAIYEQTTALRLEIVHSQKSKVEVDKAIGQLRSRELDGVICVNMLGEGFDLPNLKIAALHSPHHSLAVTLQFFGRFARVNGPGLGDAKFLAVNTEIDQELSELFQESEAWGKRIRLIGQERIAEEVETQEVLEGFESIERLSDEASIEELSLHSFNLLNHVKVFQIHGEVNLEIAPVLAGFKTEKVWLNQEQSSVIFLLKQDQRPQWTSSNALNSIDYQLVVVYFDEVANLLFICATYREEGFYSDVASALVNGTPEPLSLGKINRVLRGIADLELFNVGMRNRATGTVAESYRQLSGPAVHDAIASEDGILYHRGHIFGRGRSFEGPTTIGLSSLSKIWRLEHTKLPQLIAWCKYLAENIQNPAPVITGISLDHLDAGTDIIALPTCTLLAADWHTDFYSNPPFVLSDVDGNAVSILNFDIFVQPEKSNAEALIFELRGADLSVLLKFEITPFPKVTYLDDMQTRLYIVRTRGQTDLIEYLQDYPLHFYFEDGSILEGRQLFEMSEEDHSYDEGLMEIVDWATSNVNIQVEFGECNPPLRSIHTWLQERLMADDTQIIFYDHRPGESADFVTVAEREGSVVEIEFYHCKASGGEAPGDRIDDLSEAITQAIRSSQWRSKKILLKHFTNRCQSGSVFCRGDIHAFKAIMDAHRQSYFHLQVYVVQPGISRGALSEKLGGLLAAASHGLISKGCKALKVICSE